MATPWTASPSSTGTEKRVSPPGTNGALACDPPAVTVTVPVTAVTEASSTASTVWLWCPAAVLRLTASLTADTQSDSMTPPMLPGLQLRDVTLRSQSSPSAVGRGYDSCPPFRVTAPDCPSVSAQEKVREGVSPMRGRE